MRCPGNAFAVFEEPSGLAWQGGRALAESLEWENDRQVRDLRHQVMELEASGVVIVRGSWLDKIMAT